MKAHG
jgi:hypothetical protein